MSLGDHISMAVRALVNRPIRTALTLIGIFIGIMAVVALVSLGRGLDDAIKAEFQKSGGDKIIIMPKGSGMGPPGGEGAGNLSKRDIDLAKRVQGVDDAAGLLYKPSLIEYNKRQQIRNVISVPSDEGIDLILEAYAIEAQTGRMIRRNDKGKVMIGWELANDKTLFGQIIQPGNTIIVNNTGFKVVGIMKKKGDPDFDTGVVMTEDDERELLGLDKDTLTMIYVRVSGGVDPATVAPDILKKLRRDRGEKEGFETVDVQTLTELLESFTAIFAVVQVVLVGISLISLVVGGVGIMNTMYTSVVERTRDIGIMKSIGAKNSDILSLFFVESASLGFLGGIVGALAGAGLSKLVEIGAQASFGSPLIRASYPPALLIGVVVFSTVIGVVAGVLPAKQAASQRPVDALKYE